MHFAANIAVEQEVIVAAIMIAFLFSLHTCWSWASAEYFPGGGAKSTFYLSFSDCWRCNANGRTQNEKCPMLRQQLQTVFSLWENFTLSKCLF